MSESIVGEIIAKSSHEVRDREGGNSKVCVYIYIYLFIHICIIISITIV